MGTAIATLMGIVVAEGCGAPNCNCPADLEGPGWCPSVDPGTCGCHVSKVCPGWCLYDPDGEPVPCTDGGAGDAD